MNVTTYAFTILAARLLGPREYGALAAVMGVLLVVNVLSLGLQATGARRVSADPENRPQIEREVLATSYASALALGAVMLLAAPADQRDAQPGLLGTRGADRRDRRAALGDGRAGGHPAGRASVGSPGGGLPRRRRRAPRVRRGSAGASRPDTLGAMLGVTAGALVPVVIGTLALRRPSRYRAPGAGPVAAVHRGGRKGGVLRESAHNSHALLAFFALSNADVIIARITLDEHQAGLYAGGLILTKAVLFLPQFVVVIAFPSMARTSTGRRMHLLSLAAVLAMGAGHGGRGRDLPRARRGVRRRSRVRRPAGPAVAVRAARHRPRPDPADDLRRGRPAAPADGAGGVGRARGAALLDALRRPAGRPAHGRAVGGHAAVRGARGGAACAAQGSRCRRRPSSAERSVRGFVPARAGADRHVERDGQLGGRGHLLAHEGLECLGLPRGHLEHELVVHLQQHP